MKFAGVSYEIYTLERYVLRKDKGQSGATIEAYIEGEVGW